MTASTDKKDQQEPTTEEATAPEANEAPALSEALEAFKKQGTALASTSSRLISKLAEAMEKQSGTHKAEIDAIKKTASEKLAKDFMGAMASLSDEIEAAKTFDENDEALQSMANGLGIIHKELVKTVQKHGLDEAAGEAAVEAPTASDDQPSEAPANDDASDMLNSLLKKKKPKRPTLAKLDPFKDIDTVVTQIEDCLEEYADQDWATLEQSEDDDVKAVVAIKQGLDNAVERLGKFKQRKDQANPRAAREKEDAENFGAAKLAKEFIEVADNMDRALRAAPDDQLGKNEAFTKIYRGVEDARDKLLQAFEANGITKVNPEGEKFDPKIHEAVAPVPNSGKEKDTILAVDTAGYTIRGRVIRAPKCIVAV